MKIIILCFILLLNINRLITGSIDIWADSRENIFYTVKNKLPEHSIFIIELKPIIRINKLYIAISKKKQMPKK